MQPLKRIATVMLLACALVACSSGDDKPTKDAGSEDESDADDEQEEQADAGGEQPEASEDAGTKTESEAVPLTVWVDDLVDHHTSDDAEPDTVDDKKIRDDTDETSFDKYLP